MSNILIIDDDAMFSEPLLFYINQIGHFCDVVDNYSDGLSIIRKKEFDIIFLDVFLPDMRGLDGITLLKNTSSLPEVVIITGQGDLEGAEIALRNGAWDYIEKPVSYAKIKLIIERVLEYREQKIANNKHKLLKRDFIIGNSQKLIECLETLSIAANTSNNVFISGETGTGKELIAKAIHINSSRRAKNFITVDCTTIPPNLVEALLFGYTKGSFTGADKDKEGLIKQAHEGTLFLDEVGDLPVNAQKSLLGVLQRKCFRPLGEKKEIHCDFRVVSATNLDIKKMVEQGLFRRDLYYRLVSFSISLPPLRERTEDLKILITHYNNKICEEYSVNTKGISKDFLDHLEEYDWPGNIRELISTMRTAIAQAMNEPVLYPQHLPLELRVGFFKKKMKPLEQIDCKTSQSLLNINTNKFPKLKEFQNLIVSQYLDELIQISKGKVEEACKKAGISRSGWYHLLDKHGKK